MTKRILIFYERLRPYHKNINICSAKSFYYTNTPLFLFVNQKGSRRPSDRRVWIVYMILSVGVRVVTILISCGKQGMV